MNTQPEQCPELTRFVGGPCDGLITPNNYNGRPMIFFRGSNAFHLYERIAERAFEHWGTFPFEDEEYEPWSESSESSDH